MTRTYRSIAAVGLVLGVSVGGIGLLTFDTYVGGHSLGIRLFMLAFVPFAIGIVFLHWSRPGRRRCSRDTRRVELNPSTGWPMRNGAVDIMGYSRGGPRR